MNDRTKRVDIAGISGMFGESVTGKRERDEDYIACDEFGNVRVGVLCDGMGGGQSGDLASETAARVFITCVRESSGGLAERWSDVLTRHRALSEAIGNCHEAIVAMAGGVGLSGSTLTAVVATYGLEAIESIDLVHIGDSRCYRISHSGAEILTDDHSVTGDMVRADYIKIHEIEDTSGKNTLTRNIGDEGSSSADIVSLDPSGGSRFLLCCDGVWGPLHGSNGMWLADTDPCSNEFARLMVESALERGSTDNCSVLLADLSA